MPMGIHLDTADRTVIGIGISTRGNGEYETFNKLPDPVYMTNK